MSGESMAQEPTSGQLPAPVEGALSEFARWAEDNRQQFAGEINQTVYHYTNAAGLTGILESNELWFTDIAHLNDPSEFTICRSIADNALREEMAQADPATAVFCQEMLSGLESARKAFAMFVGSFSKIGDDLGQWRAYTDNGHGFCLGISERVFAHTDIDINPLKNPVVIQISYDLSCAEDELRESIRQATSTIKKPQVRTFCQKSSEVGKNFLIRLSVELAKHIYFHCVSFKHPAYSAEQEVRLLLINETEKLLPFVKTRQRRDEIVPYIPYQCFPALRDEGIVSIIRLGPAAPRSTEDALIQLLNSNGYPMSGVTTCVPIDRSEIPYRPL